MNRMRAASQKVRLCSGDYDHISIETVQSASKFYVSAERAYRSERWTQSGRERSDWHINHEANLSGTILKRDASPARARSSWPVPLHRDVPPDLA